MTISTQHDMQLVWPSQQYLPGYIAALERGWSSNTERAADAIQEELQKISADPVRFVEQLIDREAKGADIILPDGSRVPRLPGYSRWIWDGEFCGVINLRWQTGTHALPPHCLGHMGYSVVPWKRGRGYATLALRQMLPAAKSEGLKYVEITTDPSNVASRRVIEANGGVLIEHFIKPPQFGSTEGLRYRISLIENALDE
jgi:predicted acetyltransferase